VSDKFCIWLGAGQFTVLFHQHFHPFMRYPRPFAAGKNKWRVAQLEDKGRDQRHCWFGGLIPNTQQLRGSLWIMK